MALKRFFNATVNFIDPLVPPKLRPLWNHPAGPKTIFFWAPLCKWGTVIAGLGDLRRPANQLSLNQSLVLVGTGLIWSRWSLIIIPKNYSLCAVNLTMAGVQCIQLGRMLKHHMENQTKTH